MPIGNPDKPLFDLTNSNVSDGVSLTIEDEAKFIVVPSSFFIQ